MGRAVGIQSQIAPCLEVVVERGAQTRAVGFVEQRFQRRHHLVLFAPAGRIGILPDVGLFQEAVVVTQNLLGIDAHAHFAGPVVDGVVVALINILPGIPVGIRIGDIVAGDVDPRLRSLQGGLADIKQTVQHGLQPPAENGRLRMAAQCVHFAVTAVGFQTMRHYMAGQRKQVAAALIQQRERKLRVVGCLPGCFLFRIVHLLEKCPQGVALFFGQHGSIVEHLGSCQFLNDGSLFGGKLSDQFLYGELQTGDGVGIALPQDAVFFLQQFFQQLQCLMLTGERVINILVHGDLAMPAAKAGFGRQILPFLIFF